MTSTIPDLDREWYAWHDERERALAAPHGWLSVTGLHRLTAEPTRFPGVPGLWSATADGVQLTAHAAEGLVVPTVREARVIDATVHLHPLDDLPGSMVEHGRRVIEVLRRGALHALRVRDPQAPTRTAFAGVPAFPVDARWVRPARFEPFAEPRVIAVEAVLDGITHDRTAVGTVHVDIDGREHALVALAGRGGALVLHFRDATSGGTTYGGGRSVTGISSLPLVDAVPGGAALNGALASSVTMAPGDTTVDLNRLVNLPCAFTAFATCPLPPAGNRLDVAVEAGEQLPSAGADRP